MQKTYSYILFATVVFTILLFPVVANAQGTQAEFGQNRVQYKTFTWQFFESKNFVTYFYMGGQENGKYAVQYAEKVLPELEQLMEYRMKDRIEIMVYNDLSDLNQSNIGIGTPVHNTGGQTQIIKNKMFIYFNGDHSHFEEQIKKGIAQIMLSHLMFGGNFQEVLQNAVLMNLPQWFVMGLIEYVGKNWDANLDDRLKDAILTGRFKKINNLRGEEAAFFGHAFWHYVEEKYGKSTVNNLLYVTRTNRNLENGLMFIMGGNMKTALADFYSYYYQIFSKENDGRDIPNVADISKTRIKTNRAYRQLKLSEDATRIAYTSNDMGRWRVHTQNIETNKKKKILRGGHRTNTQKTDYQFPLLAWSPDNKTLAVIFEKRDKLRLLLYDSEAKKRNKAFITKFQSVHDFCFGEDSKTLIMSAINRGRSDVYTYFIPSTTVQQLTNDHYDDINVSWFKSETHKGILFASNRISDTLTTASLDTNTLSSNFDIYFIDRNRTDNILTKITNTPHISETNPQQYSEKYFSFLSAESGIQNRYLGYVKNIFLRDDSVYFFKDSTIVNPVWNVEELETEPDSFKINKVYKDVGEVFPQTNYVSNIVEEDIKYRSRKTAKLMLIDGYPKFFISALPSEEINEYLPPFSKTHYENFRRRKVEAQSKKEKEALQKIIEKQKQIEELASDTTELIDEPVLFFQSEFNTAPENNVRFTRRNDGSLVLDIAPAEEKQEPVFRFNKVLPYQLRFSTDYVTLNLDNSLIATRYQKYTPGNPGFDNPALGPMFTLGTADLFENYRITGGFRFPFNFSDSEYFLAYEALKKRMDKRIMYYRSSTRQVFDSEVPYFGITPLITAIEAKQKTNFIELRLNYAIDVIRSVRNSLAFRNDRTVFLSTDQISLRIPTYAENWLIYRFEYVFDRTIKTGLNLMNGLRFKVYAEIQKEFEMKSRNVVNDFNLKLPSINDAYLGMIGFDIRHYQKIHKEIIWANRFAYGNSFGTRKMLYYLGGVDSWIGLNQRFDNSIPVNEANNYAFQTIVTNMRGFRQNVRNGNNYAVINSELRIPIFSSLIHRPIRSEFVKNFQVVGFTDIGTAWEGFNPYAKENPLFTETIGGPPVTVVVNYYRNPIVVGYGVGVRSILLGYFIRLDVGWGNDSGRVGRPIAYLSFSTDF